MTQPTKTNVSRLVPVTVGLVQDGEAVNPDLFGHIKQVGADEASPRKDVSLQNISSVTVTANEQVTNTATLDASTLS